MIQTDNSVDRGLRYSRFMLNSVISLVWLYVHTTSKYASYNSGPYKCCLHTYRNRPIMGIKLTVTWSTLKWLEYYILGSQTSLGSRCRHQVSEQRVRLYRCKLTSHPNPTPYFKTAFRLLAMSIISLNGTGLSIPN